jgi:hypothetical protein
MYLDSRENDLLVYVFALDYRSMALRLRSLHPSRLVRVLGGLSVEVCSSLGLIPMIQVPVLRLAEIVVVLFGKYLTILDGLDSVVIVILFCVSHVMLYLILLP